MEMDIYFALSIEKAFSWLCNVLKKYNLISEWHVDKVTDGRFGTEMTLSYEREDAPDGRIDLSEENFDFEKVTEFFVPLVKLAEEEISRCQRIIDSAQKKRADLSIIKDDMFRGISRI